MWLRGSHGEHNADLSVATRGLHDDDLESKTLACTKIVLPRCTQHVLADPKLRRRLANPEPLDYIGRMVLGLGSHVGPSQVACKYS